MNEKPRLRGLIIKGLADYLLLTVDETTEATLYFDIQTLIKERQQFFSGAKLMIDFGNLALKVNDLSPIRDFLSEERISLIGIRTSDQTTDQSARLLGMKVNPLPGKTSQEIEKPIEINMPGEDALLIQKTIRSGVQIDTPRHVIIVGDVNPGARVRSEGVIIVWGKARGELIAGSAGEKNVYICAFELSPAYLEISGFVYQGKYRKGKPAPEIAYIEKNQIRIGIWN